MQKLLYQTIHAYLLRNFALLHHTYLVRAAKAIAKLDLSGDEATGAAIVARAVEEPLRQLAANGGYEGSVVGNTKRKHDGYIGTPI